MAAPKEGTVVDRETTVDEQGKRHIRLVCELPDLSGKGATLGKKPT